MNQFNKITIRNQSGVSIVETTVIISVIALMMIVLASTFLVQLRLTKVMTNISQMQNNRSIIFGLVQQQVHLANQVVTSANINGVDFTSATNTLVLQIPSIDANGAIIDNTYDLVAIYRDPVDFTRLLFDRESDPASSRPDVIEKVLTADMESFDVGYNADQPYLTASLYIHMVLSRNVLGIDRRIPLDTYLLLKNL